MKKLESMILEESGAGIREVRWQQRLDNFKRAFAQLGKFIDKGNLNELEEQGLIQAFEYTFELAWNVMKDYFTFQGLEGIHGRRDAIRLAFSRGLVEDGEGWMAMLKSRIQSSHTYEEETAKEIATGIFDTYYYLFDMLLQKMETLSGKEVLSEK